MFLWQRFSLGLGLTLTLSSLLSFSPALAENKRLWVIRSGENQPYWNSIKNRISSLNINACYLDIADLKTSISIPRQSLLLLPNVENLNDDQLKVMESWLQQGGKIIATGPVGTDSSTTVRNQLQSLLGAYWGFPLSTPSTLQPLNIVQNSHQLGGSIYGGVVIPSAIVTQTDAVWLSNGMSPAIISTDKTALFGWRWGVDNVSSVSLDNAWLSHFITRYGGVETAKRDELLSCLQPEPVALVPSSRPSLKPLPSPSPRVTPFVISTPVVSTGETLRVNKPNKTTPVTQPQGNTVTPVVGGIIPVVVPTATSTPTPTVTPTPSLILPPERVITMGKELEGLIGRVESAILAIKASQESASVATDKANSSTDVPLPAEQAVLIAKQGLDNFYRLTEEQQFESAQEQWDKARSTLLSNYPINRPYRQGEVRAVWFDRGTIVKAKSKQDLVPYFDRLKQAGINTIFFETVNSGYPIYPSKIAPEQNPLTQGWDPLQSAIELAHERGMELHAWVWVFAGVNQRHNEVLGQPTDYLGPVLSQHPDWVLPDNQGNIFDPQNAKAFFDPANPQVRSYLLSLFSEIVTRYDVDGLQLDYIRYPFQDPYRNKTYGYSDIARLQFITETGIDPINLTLGDPNWSKWTEFRTQKIDTFVENVSKTLKTIKPNLILSVAVFPFPRFDRLARLQQNWEKWAEEGYIDMVVPMTYAESSEELKNITNDLFQTPFTQPSLMLPSVRLLNLSALNAIDQLQLIRDLPTDGYSLFSVQDFNTDIEKFLDQQQQEISKNHPILPYRQPLASAVLDYQELKQEWNFVMNNNDGLIEDTLVKEWGKTADDVLNHLQELAETPNEKNLLFTRLSLSALRLSLPRITQKYKQQYPYQVQVWDNRLLSLTRLIDYAETKMAKQ